MFNNMIIYKNKAKEESVYTVPYKPERSVSPIGGVKKKASNTSVTVSQKRNGVTIRSSKMIESYESNLDDSIDTEFFQQMNDEGTFDHNAKNTFSFDKRIAKSSYVSNKLEEKKIHIEEDFREGGKNDKSDKNGKSEKNQLQYNYNDNGPHKVNYGVIDTGVSSNPIIRVFDELMNDPANLTQNNFFQVRQKILSFAKNHTVSEEIGDLLFRLGLKHTAEGLNDIKGALDCFDSALKIYMQVKSYNRGNQNNLRSAEALKKISDCYLNNDDFFSALKNLEVALQMYKFALGDTCIEVADCLFKKGYIAQCEEKWTEAEESYSNALSVYKNVFGITSETEENAINKVEIADCYFKLGIIHEKLKNYKASEEFYSLALNIYRNHFGNEYNDICSHTLFNLGIISESANNKEKALDYFTRAENILKEIKPDDRDYSDVLLKTGTLYLAFSKSEKAMQSLSLALEIVKNSLHCEKLEQMIPILAKEESLDRVSEVLELTFALTKIYFNPNFKKFREGIKTLRIVMFLMPVEKESLEETFDLLKTFLETVETNKTNKKFIQDCEQDLTECIYLYATKLETEKELIVGEGINISNISSMNISNSNSNGLIFNKNQIVNNNNLSVSGIENTSIANYCLSINKIAEIFNYLARMCSKITLTKVGIEMAIKSITFFEKLSQDVPLKLKICDILNNIGIEYTSLGMNDQALKYFEKTLEMRIKYNGEETIKTAGAYNNLAIAYDKMKMYKEAIDVWKKCMEIRTKLLPADDVKIANSFYNFSLILSKIKEYEQALNTMLKSLDIFDKKVGADSQFSADSALSIGDYLKNLNRPVEAIDYLQRAFDTYLKKQGPNGISTLKSQILLGICYSKIKKYEKSISALKPAVDALYQGDSSETPALLIVEAWYELGNSYDALNDYIQGLQCFEIVGKYAADYWDDHKLTEIETKISNLKCLAEAARYKLKK